LNQAFKNSSGLLVKSDFIKNLSASVSLVLNKNEKVEYHIDEDINSLS